MPVSFSQLSQKTGATLPEWNACPPPRKEAIHGQYCRLEPVSIERHGADLWQAFNTDTKHLIWTYLPYGPFDKQSELEDWISATCLGDDPLFYAVIDLKNGSATGMASYLRIQPEVGVIEVGHINFSPMLQQTTAATEAMYLMMKNAFDLGYRRYEWKCDNLNLGSQAAANRLGFSYDGLFKQATIYKNRNRDTAWFSILDSDWPSLREGYLTWLVGNNFDAGGAQKSKLHQSRLG
jgi:RimJ/RimL family protein N-acetyltransferase